MSDPSSVSPMLAGKATRRERAGWLARRPRPELCWAIAFIFPYAAVFLAFGAYPMALALWMARSPALYVELLAEPLYPTALLNTLLFVGVGVNLKMFVALLLSAFFLRRGWWIKALLVIFVVPWFVATVQACLSFHWILIGQYGLLDGLIEAIFGLQGPDWFNDRWLALGCNIWAYMWKWMPLWTLVFMAGRMAIPGEIYDAAAVDGATGRAGFVHVTFPLLANLYLVCTLLATVWAFGDFATAYFVSNGAPTNTTNVLATLSYRYAFDDARPAIGIATALSALPLVVPAVVFVMHRLQTREVQL